MAVNDFDKVAPYYDKLGGLIFGDKLRKATENFLGEIAPGHSILILGGGTGAVLEALPQCKKITFLDRSQRMVSKARQRNAGQQVDFIRSDFLTYPMDEKFDVIICPFFLDCFNEENLGLALGKIQELLTPKGRLIVIDFQNGRSSWLIRLMHVFFRLVSSLESKKLKEIHHFIAAKQFKVEREEFFNKNLIFSRVYRNL